MMVPMLHDLPEVRAPVCKWRMLTGQIKCGELCVKVARNGTRAAGYYRRWPVAAAGDPEFVDLAWRLGVPAMEWDGSDIEQVLGLVEAVAPFLQPIPDSLLPTVGFRAYCAEDLGLPIPWTWWSGNESPRCNAHKQPPVVRCHCGFHVADDPWHVARTYPEYHGVLVVAPFGKVVMHRYGARAQHYDVVAYVTTPENVTIEDQRVVRARNVPLRAWEVARELAAAASAGLR